MTTKNEYLLDKDKVFCTYKAARLNSPFFDTSRNKRFRFLKFESERHDVTSGRGCDSLFGSACLRVGGAGLINVLFIIYEIHNDILLIYVLHCVLNNH